VTKRVEKQRQIVGINSDAKVEVDPCPSESTADSSTSKSNKGRPFNRFIKFDRWQENGLSVDTSGSTATGPEYGKRLARSLIKNNIHAIHNCLIKHTDEISLNKREIYTMRLRIEPERSNFSFEILDEATKAGLKGCLKRTIEAWQAGRNSNENAISVEYPLLLCRMKK